MGIRQISIVILVLILLASTASAVSFEWALGNHATRDVCYESYNDETNSCFGSSAVR